MTKKKENFKQRFKKKRHKIYGLPSTVYRFGPRVRTATVIDRDRAEIDFAYTANCRLTNLTAGAARGVFRGHKRPRTQNWAPENSNHRPRFVRTKLSLRHARVLVPPNIGRV